MMDFTTLRKYLASGCLNIFCHIFSFPLGSPVNMFQIFLYFWALLVYFPLWEMALFLIFSLILSFSNQSSLNSISSLLYLSIEFLILVTMFLFYNISLQILVFHVVLQNVIWFSIHINSVHLKSLVLYISYLN